MAAGASAELSTTLGAAAKAGGEAAGVSSTRSFLTSGVSSIEAAAEEATASVGAAGGVAERSRLAEGVVVPVEAMAMMLMVVNEEKERQVWADLLVAPQASPFAARSMCALCEQETRLALPPTTLNARRTSSST